MGFVKRATFLFGVLSIAVLLAAFMGTTYVLHRSHSLDRESHAFADAAITAVARHWSADELLRRAAPQFLRASTPDSVRSFLATAATRFGPMVSYDGAEGRAERAADSDTAIYVSHARFQNGEAEFQIALVRVAGEWKISGFRLNAPEPVQRFDERSV